MESDITTTIPNNPGVPESGNLGPGTITHPTGLCSGNRPEVQPAVPARRRSRSTKPKRLPKSQAITSITVIAKYLASLPERHKPADWWGQDYQPVFANETDEPLLDFLTLDRKAIEREMPQILEYLRAYLEYQLRATRWERFGTLPEPKEDWEEFWYALRWAQARPDVVAALVEEIERVPRYERLAAWPRYVWIAYNTSPEQRAAHGPAIARLRARGRREMVTFGKMFEGWEMLELFGFHNALFRPTADEWADYKARFAQLPELEGKISIVRAALDRLDLIEGRTERKLMNRGRYIIYRPNEGHPDVQ